VPGDLVLLEEGDNVPRGLPPDRRIRPAREPLDDHGESLAKVAGPHKHRRRQALDARNVLLAGTSLVSGTGGRWSMRRHAHRVRPIAHLTQTVGETGSPLQREIRPPVETGGVLASAIGQLASSSAWRWACRSWHSAMFAIGGIIVANVPEGLLPR